MPRNGFKRPQPTIDLRPKILVACEDSKSGRSYLKQIERVHRLATVQFEILKHEGTDPKTVVGQLAARIKIEKKQQGWAADRDEAWALFDGDEHRQTEGQRVNWNDAMQQGGRLENSFSGRQSQHRVLVFAPFPTPTQRDNTARSIGTTAGTLP